jgi:hypothetical protein
MNAFKTLLNKLFVTSKLETSSAANRQMLFNGTQQVLQGCQMTYFHTKHPNLGIF